MTPAGVVNLVGLIGALIVVLTAGLTDGLQALVRIAEPTYSAGLPSAAALLSLYLVCLIVCVALLALLTPPRRR
jgi:hypothetical protein